MRAASVPEGTRTGDSVALGVRAEVRGNHQQMTAPSKGVHRYREPTMPGATLPLVKRMENALWEDGLSFLLCCIPAAPKPSTAHGRTVRGFEIQSNTNPAQGSLKGQREI